MTDEEYVHLKELEAENARLRAAVSRGAHMIAIERRRQIEQEGWTAEHDDGHTDGSLALAAVCYATPEKIYVCRKHAAGMVFDDPWPKSWDDAWDKRYTYEGGNVIPDPSIYRVDKRIAFLVKAGALIAAEIDRLNRIATRAKEPAQ